MLEISLLAEGLLASEEVLCPKDLLIYVVSAVVFTTRSSKIGILMFFMFVSPSVNIKIPRRAA
jgi:hypothetical protein